MTFVTRQKKRKVAGKGSKQSVKKKEGPQTYSNCDDSGHNKAYLLGKHILITASYKIDQIIRFDFHSSQLLLLLVLSLI